MPLESCIIAWLILIAVGYMLTDLNFCLYDTMLLLWVIITGAVMYFINVILRKAALALKILRIKNRKERRELFKKLRSI